MIAHSGKRQFNDLAIYIDKNVQTYAFSSHVLFKAPVAYAFIPEPANAVSPATTTTVFYCCLTNMQPVNT